MSEQIAPMEDGLPTAQEVAESLKLPPEMYEIDGVMYNRPPIRLVLETGRTAGLMRAFVWRHHPRGVDFWSAEFRRGTLSAEACAELEAILDKILDKKREDLRAAELRRKLQIFAVIAGACAIAALVWDLA